MAESPLRLIKRIAEYVPRDKVMLLPPMLRGIYVLYKECDDRRGAKEKYDVKYVGMARAGKRGGLRHRLRSHLNSKRKGKQWTHFSVFEVWPNIRDDEVVEIEGLIRFILRKDSTASSLNIQRGFKKARKIRINDLGKWHHEST